MIQNFNKRHGGFTLVEIMIVVAIIALLAAIAVPGFLRARKRSQASTLLNNLRLLDAAKDQYAIEYNIQNGSPAANQVELYLKRSTGLYNAADSAGTSGTFADPKMGSITYNLNDYNTLPSLSGAKSGFSDVIEDIFWSPYSVQ